MSGLLGLPPWGFMWGLALALYASAKIATLAGSPSGAPLGRRLAYLLLFPGMNASAFCGRAAALPARSAGRQPIAAYLANILVGAALLWGLARSAPAQFPLLQGWIGMVGFILLLHFGLLQLIARAWQNAGFDAPPLMDRPFRAASLGEFWSVRWNTSFRQLSHQFIFLPLARRTGARIAALLTFAVSGIVHDLVISLPAGGGFGLPTAYFLLQAAGVSLERSRTGRRWLSTRLRRRCFALGMVTVPVLLLFHPLFVTRVFVPFMSVLGALPREVV